MDSLEHLGQSCAHALSSSVWLPRHWEAQGSSCRLVARTTWVTSRMPQARVEVEENQGRELSNRHSEKNGIYSWGLRCSGVSRKRDWVGPEVVADVKETHRKQNQGQFFGTCPVWGQVYSWYWPLFLCWINEWMNILRSYGPGRVVLTTVSSSCVFSSFQVTL